MGQFELQQIIGQDVAVSSPHIVTRSLCQGVPSGQAFVSPFLIFAGLPLGGVVSQDLFGTFGTNGDLAFADVAVNLVLVPFGINGHRDKGSCLWH